jgi:hypothetical protein
MFCEYYMLSRKNPALFQKPLILALYAVLLNTPFIACKSFIHALSLDSKGLCADWRRRPIDGLNGLRPMLRGCLLHLDPRTAFCALAPGPSFHGALSYRFVFGQKIWQMMFFSSKANSQIFRSFSQSLAQVLRVRETRALWFYFAVPDGIP